MTPDVPPVFGISEKGVGIRVDLGNAAPVAHEVFFEDDITEIRERPLFVGEPIPRRRTIGAALLVGGLLAAFLGRAFWMQIVNGAAYRERAEENRLRVELLPARRGVIRDRTGVVLAENIPSFDVHLIPWLLPTAGDARDELLGRLGREVGRSLDELRSAVASSTRPGERLLLARDIPYSQAIRMQISIGGVPAVAVVTQHKRSYPQSGAVPSLSHLLGYVGPVSREDLDRFGDAYRQTDTIGKTGIEASYEDELRGRHGDRMYEVDARDRVTSLVGEHATKDGADLALTLDLSLQRAAETALARELRVAGLTRGAVVAMDPRDGSIRALVSLPAYDDNLFSGTVSSTYYASLLADPSRPLVPRAWSGVYPSGSTIKPVIATAALSERVVSAETTVNSVGGIRIGSSFFPDWKAGGHGITNVRKAIAWSVNTFFYYVGGGYESFIGLGVDRLGSWMRRFGLGAKTGLDLPGESNGFVPSKEWKEQVKGERWYVGDTYNLSIGQGDLLVTPLQIATVTAEVANGGKRLVPHLVSQDAPRPAGATTTVADDPSVIRTVQLGMRDTVVYGSGRALAGFPVHVAGKTGTAQWRNDKPNHAWFTSFAPFEDPEIVVTVLLEEGGEGSSVALPVAREVLDAWLRERTR